MEPYDKWDPLRTLRMAGFGLIILGPAQHLWFNFVARVLPKRDLITIFKKLAMGQLVFGPTINGIFFSFNAALQGILLFLHFILENYIPESSYCRYLHPFFCCLFWITVIVLLAECCTTVHWLQFHILFDETKSYGQIWVIKCNAYRGRCITMQWINREAISCFVNSLWHCIFQFLCCHPWSITKAELDASCVHNHSKKWVSAHEVVSWNYLLFHELLSEWFALCPA